MSSLLQTLSKRRREIVKKFKEHFKRLIDDEKFRDSIIGAVPWPIPSIPSLIKIFEILYKHIEGASTSEEEKVVNRFFSIIFQTINESLANCNIELKEELENVIKEYESQLINIMEIEKEATSIYIYNHPLIEETIKLFSGYLIKKNIEPEKIANFNALFKYKIQYEIEKDELIQKYYEHRILHEKKKDFMLYLEHMLSLGEYYVKGFDTKPLKEYFVEQYVVEVDTFTWNRRLEEEDLKSKVRIFEKIDEFLNNDERWIIFVASEYGLGKTCFAKMYTSYLAEKYLDALSKGNTKDCYVPIYVSLKRGENNVYDNKSLGYVFNIIPKSENLLIILDGLDDYRNSIKGIFKCIQKLSEEEGRRIKIIVTSRMIEEYASEYENYIGDKYLRILPFDEKQIDTWIEKYGIKLSIKELYDLGLDWDIVSKPLFLWLISSIFLDESLRIKFYKKWSKSMKNAMLYVLLVHKVLKGKIKEEVGSREWENSYTKEKKMLRYISKYLFVNDGSIDYEELNNKMIREGYKKEDLESLILSTYTEYVKSGETRKVIEFIHKSFLEYLLAEYYIDVVASGKSIEDKSKLAIGKPSYETINYLGGLLNLINYFKENIHNLDERIKEILKCFIESLSIKMNVEENLENIINKLSDTAYEWFLDDSMVFSNSIFSFYTSENKVHNKIFLVRNIGKLIYNIWIDRWISLYIFNTLSSLRNKNAEEYKEKLEILIRFSYHIPGEIKKLSYADLSEADLSHVNLSYANLIEANLVKANLSYADLSEVDLSHANLSYADLSYAELSSADLIGTNLSYADLSCVNLSYANLSGANLIGVDLVKANLSEAYLIRANLSFADLSFTELSEANLSFADLSGVDLVGAILSYADLSGTNLIGADLSHTKFQNTIFKNSFIADDRFVNYLRTHGALDVPNAITDANKLKDILRERGYSDTDIKHILSFFLKRKNN